MRYRHGDEMWAIELAGAQITITDATGTRVEELATPQLATTRHRVLVNQKLRAGWRLDKPVAEQEPAPAIPAAPVVFDAREPALEAAIVADPEAEESYRIYGDWLLQQGDPRGELIARYAHAKAYPTDRKLADAVRLRLDRHKDYFLSDVPRGMVSFEWGFIAGISISRRNTLGALAPMLARVLALPSARFVRRIALDDDDGTGGDLADAIALVAKRAPPTLRKLELRGHTALRELHTIAPRLADLRALALTAPIPPSASCFDTLVESPFPRLESLELELAEVADLPRARPLLHRRDLPMLSSLWIDAAFDHAFRDVLATAPIAGQLRSLTLPQVRQEDFAALLHWLDAFPKLDRLGVAKGYWPMEDQIALAGRVADVWDYNEHYAALASRRRGTP